VSPDAVDGMEEGVGIEHDHQVVLPRSGDDINPWILKHLRVPLIVDD
jgi:hypothetical protein